MCADLNTSEVTHLPDKSPKLSLTLAESDFDQLAQIGFVVIDEALPAQFLKVVQTAMTQVALRPAAIASGLQRTIRGDEIAWLAPELGLWAQHYLALLEQLGQQLGRAMMTPINQVEAHLACYAPGQGYARHRDNAHGQQRRLFSLVWYLTPQWLPTWGGQLNLQDQHEAWHQIEPISNRLVIFRSDLLHEVQPATQTRWSITAWLRYDL